MGVNSILPLLGNLHVTLPGLSPTILNRWHAEQLSAWSWKNPVFCPIGCSLFTCVYWKTTGSSAFEP